MQLPDLNELRDAAELGATIAGAVDAGILEAIAERGSSAGELTEALGLDGRAVRAVLGLLEEMGIVVTDPAHGSYAVTAPARALLVDRDSPQYAAAGLGLWLRNLRAWTHLPEVLREGGPAPGGAVAGESDEAALARYMAGMAAAPAERVARVVSSCLARRPGARRALDLGGGPGHFARGFAARRVETTLFDTPETIEFVRAAYGLDDVPGLRTAAGDFRADPLGGPYDIVLLSNVTHLYGPDTNRHLLATVGTALSRGGLVAIADFVRGRSPRAAGFAVLMLLRTEEGGTHTEAEYREWLAGAGFADPVLEDVDPERQLITALRP